MAKWLRKKDLLKKNNELYDRVKELETCVRRLQSAQCGGKHTWAGGWFSDEVRCAKCGRKADEGDKYEALTGRKPYVSLDMINDPIVMKSVGEVKDEDIEARDK